MLIKILLVFLLIYQVLGLLSILVAILKLDNKEDLATCFNRADYLKESDSLFISVLVSFLDFSIFAAIIVCLIRLAPVLFIVWVMVLSMEFIYTVAHITSDILGVGRWSVMTVPRISLLFCEGVISIIGLFIMIIS